MNYELLLADIDGTLTGADGQIAKETIDTVAALKDNGIKFATASAHSKSNTTKILGALNQFCDAQAFLNGALIEGSNGTVIHDQPIDPESLQALNGAVGEHSKKTGMQYSICYVGYESL